MPEDRGNDGPRATRARRRAPRPAAVPRLRRVERPGAGRPSSTPAEAGADPAPPTAPPDPPDPPASGLTAPATPSSAGLPASDAAAGSAPYPEWSTTPPPPSPLQRSWPGPEGAAPRVALAAAAVAGTVAAVSVPLDRPGLGWLITGVVAAAATATVAHRAAPAPARRSTGSRLARMAWGGAALALLAVGTIRAAGWLFVLCVITACVAGSFALTTGHSARTLVTRATAVPVAALRALPWLRRGLATRPARGAARLGVAFIATASLLLVFGALFASADAAFATLVSGVTPNGGTLFRWAFLFSLVGLGTSGAAYLVVAPPALDTDSPRQTRTLRRIEWALPVVVLLALFTVFVTVQLTVLFGGRRHVLDTAGLTYAEYARGGFWQLLAVTVLTLAVIAAAARWAPRDTKIDRFLIRAVLGGLAMLTLVIVASALYRMTVYEQAYGFTRLRVLVSACELWLGVVFLMVLAAGVRLRARWLPRAVVATAVGALLGLALLDPDQFIAERNVERFAETGQIDVAYLSRLSADAAPALDRLPPRHRHCALAGIATDLASHPDDWRGWNRARETARQMLADRPAERCQAVPQRSGG